MTDAGRAYAKTLGNPEGPDALVSEWIGTGLARWLGLPTFDVAVVDYPDELSFKLPKGCETQAGPAFIACEVRGRSWGGGEDDLTWVENPEDICGLVVFDTWTRNYDRYAESSGPPRCNFRNVFFCEEGAKKGRYRLLAIDHSECFRMGRALSTRNLLDLDAIRDERLYGLFPEFRGRVTREGVRRFVDKLASFREQDFDAYTTGLPPAWGLRAENAGSAQRVLRRAGQVSSRSGREDTRRYMWLAPSPSRDKLEVKDDGKTIALQHHPVQA